MRLSSSLVFAICVVGCGDSGSTTAPVDLSAAAPDLATGGGTAADMKMVTPYNMPGKVFCYGSLTCSTTSASPVCCDTRADGGFSDACVATVAGCAAMDPQARAYQCGQAADCGSGMVCCGTTGMSGSGKPFLSATTCAASCTSAQAQLCVTAAECKTAGASCAGQTLSGRDVGVCK
ncbi:MAG: hypothetical protein JWM53_3904 [bacterium]|nr:hypothetical protein [bacterium]